MGKKKKAFSQSEIKKKIEEVSDFTNGFPKIFEALNEDIPRELINRKPNDFIGACEEYSEQVFDQREEIGKRLDDLVEISKHLMKQTSPQTDSVENELLNATMFLLAVLGQQYKAVTQIYEDLFITLDEIHQADVESEYDDEIWIGSDGGRAMLDALGQLKKYRKLNEEEQNLENELHTALLTHSPDFHSTTNTLN